jgi:hypothetical protein
MICIDRIKINIFDNSIFYCEIIKNSKSILSRRLFDNYLIIVTVILYDLLLQFNCLIADRRLFTMPQDIYI